MSQTMQWAAIAGTVLVIVLALYKIYKALNSSDGERYQRQQTQGPFAPSEEKIASADQADGKQS
jgi:ABC-type nickel/cobalt efflux system permease component RcnA